jgi:hypothetical protein
MFLNNKYMFLNFLLMNIYLFPSGVEGSKESVGDSMHQFSEAWSHRLAHLQVASHDHLFPLVFSFASPLSSSWQEEEEAFAARRRRF